MKIVDLQEMKEIERMTFEEYAMEESLIIENVGIRVADYLDQHYLNNHQYGELVFLIGSGNNGSDGLAVARHLINKGHRCRAFILFPDEKFTDQMNQQLQMAGQFGVKISEVRKVDDILAYFTQTQEEYFVVDAIFGTGVRYPLSNFIFDVINVVNDYASFLVAIDIPTGVCGQTGLVDSQAIKANVTLAIGLLKQGHFLGQSPRFCGELFVIDAGFPKELIKGGDKALITSRDIIELYHPRSDFDHKYSFGHTLVIGGSQGLTGALILAAQGALSIGSGLVTAATWPVNYGELVTRITPDIITGVLPRGNSQMEASINSLEKYDAIVVGPGLGRTTEGREIVLEVLNNFSKPVLLDADSFIVLSFDKDKEIFKSRQTPTVLTPHYVEFAKFIGVDVQDVYNNPLEYIRKFVDETNSTLILKGPCTYLAFPDGKIFFNYSPNSGLSKGGSGDILSGILGGLLAQSAKKQKVHRGDSLFRNDTDFFHSMIFGVFVHSESAKMAAQDKSVQSMRPSDLPEYIGKLHLELDQEVQKTKRHLDRTQQ